VGCAQQCAHHQIAVPYTGYAQKPGNQGAKEKEQPKIDHVHQLPAKEALFQPRESITEDPFRERPAQFLASKLDQRGPTQHCQGRGDASGHIAK
jgi:hypothetical protein